MLQTTMSKKEKIRKRLSFLSGNTFSIQVSNALYADLNVIPIAYAIRVMPTGFTNLNKAFRGDSSHWSAGRDCDIGGIIT